MILRLGKRFTSFVSYYTCQDDSIEVLPGHARLKLQRFHARVSNLDSIRRAGISTTSEYLYKDRQKDSCYVYGRVGEIGRKEAVVVKEKIPVMKWMQQDSVKMVCGYRCRKATTSFRGRTYVAWYTPDLPFQEGPWKLCGLPGLILEAYDKDRHYFYSAAEIVLSPGYPVTFYNWYERSISRWNGRNIWTVYISRKASIRLCIRERNMDMTCRRRIIKTILTYNRI